MKQTVVAATIAAVVGGAAGAAAAWKIAGRTTHAEPTVDCVRRADFEDYRAKFGDYVVKEFEAQLDQIQKLRSRVFNLELIAHPR